MLLPENFANFEMPQTTFRAFSWWKKEKENVEYELSVEMYEL